MCCQTVYDMTEDGVVTAIGISIENELVTLVLLYP